MEPISAYCGFCKSNRQFSPLSREFYSCTECGGIKPLGELERTIEEKPLEIQRFEDEGRLASI